jgi:hypothetical protein
MPVAKKQKERKEPTDQKQEGATGHCKVHDMVITHATNPARSYIQGRQAVGEPRTLIVEISAKRCAGHRDMAIALMEEIEQKGMDKQQALNRRQQLVGY